MDKSKLPVIPKNVTVHLGKPSEYAENVTVSFPNYIKNVASSEIYPTWPENALIANIYAQISFVLNRIYTEYYRSRGYNFDITNSTQFDQFFVNGRDIFENISRIVDRIFDGYVIRKGDIEPLFTQYCNGTTSLCDGLSQWGTVSLANKGLSPIEILRSYYGSDIEIRENVPVEAVSASLPLRPLKLGSTGSDVESIQIRLNRISTNYPFIPKINPINGVFALDTQNAVKAFQTVFNLESDGIVGKSTWYKIQYIYNSVKRLSELDSEGLSLDEIPRQFPENLSLGSRGEGVKIVQFILSYISVYNNKIPKINIDGIFGPATKNAVSAYQHYVSLNPDGIVDEQTYNALYNTYRGIILSLPDTEFVGTARPFPGFPITEGQRNSYVMFLQEYLNEIGSVYREIPQINVDGIFGPATKRAVLAYQKTFGLAATGIVNLTTWVSVTSLYEDLIKGSIVSEGQFPSGNFENP